jgi:pimeloyl-ACP methyl ester carboxylesterase
MASPTPRRCGTRCGRLWRAAWGALLVLRAASRQPDVARTWAAGGAPLDPDYEWHRAAKLWQAPGVGERVMESTTPEVALPGCSHWWQLERPDAVANHLEALWASVP